jgi:DNA polymerase I-like protein with 3'-5' exonuclease and polymerase domains
MTSNLILDPDALRREVEIIGNVGRFAFDMETIPSAPGMDDRGVPARNQALWIGLATTGRTCQIPMGHPIGTKIIGEALEPRADKNGKIRNFRVPVYEKPPEQLDRGTVFELLEPLFGNPDIEKSGHGLSFDAASVAKYRGGLIPAGRLVCTIEARHLLDEDRLKYGLKYITKSEYGFEYDNENVGKTVEKFPLEMVRHYLHCDVKYTWLEREKLVPQIIEQGLEELWNMECELTRVLSDMRCIGARMDIDRLHELKDEMSVLVGERERKVYAAAGKKFNLNSVQQKQALLYKPKPEGQGLEGWRMTKGGQAKEKAGQQPDHTFYSTDDEALSSYPDNDLAAAILEYQEANKVYTTYVIGYLGDPDDKDKPARVFDGIVYPDFVQYGAATGRFSCREPNLQNVPRPGTDLGKMVRSLFIPRQGCVFVVADYSQIELVLLAHFIGFGAFWDGFLNGIDPHTMTAALALGIDPASLQQKVNDNDKDAKNARQNFGKSINFATVYGAGLKKLASMMKVSYDRAKMFKRTYDRNTPEISDYRNEVLHQARRHSKARTGFPPHTKTLMGRMRRLPMLLSSEEWKRMYAERQAFNHIFQGSSADLTKMSMVRFHKRVKELQKDWNLILTVHDELVVECPEGEAEDCRDLLVWAMTGDGIQDLVSLPLKVESHIVTNWSDAK